LAMYHKEPVNIAASSGTGRRRKGNKMPKRLFVKGETYRVEESNSKYDDVGGEYVRTLKNQKGARFAEFRQGTRTWWIPEMYWKYIKKETNK